MIRLFVFAALLVVLASPGAASVASQAPPSAGKSDTPRLEPALADALTEYHEAGPAQALDLAAERGAMVWQDRVRVTVEAAEGRGPEAIAAVKAAGGLVEQRHGGLLQAALTLPALERLAESDAVRFVSRVDVGRPQVVSEGVSLTGADGWHSAGLTGEGVEIAIIDAGFDGYQDLLGTELPASVSTLVARSDGVFDEGPHGTAVAEIVYDMAPDAELHLIAVDSVTSVGVAVDYAIAEDVDVITMSLAYLSSGTGDGTGPINEIVDEATAAGITWVNSAGNYARRHWSGPWDDPNGNDFLNFAGADETNQMTLPNGQVISVLLLWNDPWDASCNDYDLWVLNSDQSAVVTSSLSPQDCDSAPPGELVTFTTPYNGTYHIAVEMWAADAQATFDLFTLSTTPEHLTEASSIVPPADNAGAIAAGAVPWFAPDDIEGFSSRGPANDGRLKPELVAPDGTSGTVYGESGFFGTSASAPHTAAAAALVLELNPCFSRTDVQTFLEDAAVDIGDPGPDNVYGAGRLDLGTVPTSACATPTPTPSPTPTPTPTPPPTPTPSPTPTPAPDADNDGFPDADELIIGTDPTDACADTTTPDDEDDDKWPPDFDDDRSVTTVDIFKVLPPTFGTTVPPTSPRRDLSPDGSINTIDVFHVLPPTFGSTCTP